MSGACVLCQRSHRKALGGIVEIFGKTSALVALSKSSSFAASDLNPALASAQHRAVLGCQGVLLNPLPFPNPDLL